jgi:hypothetical protein
MTSTSSKDLVMSAAESLWMHGVLRWINQNRVEVEGMVKE